MFARLASFSIIVPTVLEGVSTNERDAGHCNFATFHSRLDSQERHIVQCVLTPNPVKTTTQDDAVLGDMIAQQSSVDSGNQTASASASASGASGVGQTLEKIPEDSGEHNSNSYGGSSSSTDAGGQSSRSAAAPAPAPAPAAVAVAAAATMRLPQARSRAESSGRHLLSRGKVVFVHDIICLVHLMHLFIVLYCMYVAFYFLA